MSLYGREAMAFFDKLKEADAGNGKCVDCGANSPLWASLSYGTYFCLECSGVHRNLGVHISFVRSLNMDSWSEQQQQRMTCGGNTAFRQYLRQCGMPEELQSGGGQFAGCESQAEGAIRQKYNTRSAAAYRAWLAERSRGEGGAPAPPSVPCARESGASRSKWHGLRACGMPRVGTSRRRRRRRRPVATAARAAAPQGLGSEARAAAAPPLLAALCKGLARPPPARARCRGPLFPARGVGALRVGARWERRGGGAGGAHGVVGLGAGAAAPVTPLLATALPADRMHAAPPRHRARPALPSRARRLAPRRCSVRSS